jgi:purine-nucleoside/S-methyl-5'-thioadenosine phosphorylase / adenosine deaminase
VLIDVALPEPYRVAYSTRRGGVSEGPYESLNLGLLSTRDDPDRVIENRRLLCAAVGADAERAAMAWQLHGAQIRRARPIGITRPGTRFEQCDGIWSDEPGQPLALIGADCPLVALWRTEGQPALCLVHAGWAGLLQGALEAGVRALGASQVAAAVGPAIGVCCYQVGDDVAAPYRRRFGRAVVSNGRLDLRAAADRALRDAGCRRVDHVERCTACEPDAFFSHRRDGVTGRQGIIGFVTRS